MGIRRVEGLAFDGSTHALFGTTSPGGPLYAIDTTTAAVTLIGTTGDTVTSLAASR